MGASISIPASSAAASNHMRAAKTGPHHLVALAPVGRPFGLTSASAWLRSATHIGEALRLSPYSSQPRWSRLRPPHEPLGATTASHVLHTQGGQLAGESLVRGSGYFGPTIRAPDRKGGNGSIPPSGGASQECPAAMSSLIRFWRLFDQGSVGEESLRVIGGDVRCCPRTSS